MFYPRRSINPPVFQIPNCEVLYAEFFNGSNLLTVWRKEGIDTDGEKYGTVDSFSYLIGMLGVEGWAWGVQGVGTIPDIQSTTSEDEVSGVGLLSLNQKLLGRWCKT